TVGFEQVRRASKINIGAVGKQVEKRRGRENWSEATLRSPLECHSPCSQCS
ncbi:unnamed protein product, partial [Musa acuminata var. zebrina]